MFRAALFTIVKTRKHPKCPLENEWIKMWYTYTMEYLLLFLVSKFCLTLCNPMDCSPPGSSVQGILQAAMLEWVAMPSSRGSSQPRDQTCVSCTAGRFFTTEPPKRKKVKSLSRVRLFATPWTVAYQVPPSMGFSRQEYWSGLPFPSPGDLPNPEIEPGSPAL